MRALASWALVSEHKSFSLRAGRCQHFHSRRYWNAEAAILVGAQIIHMANDSSLIPAAQSAAADPDFVAGAGLASATPSSTMRGALEAMHSVDLGHPNIVQTFKSTQRAVQARRPLPTPPRLQRHYIYHPLFSPSKPFKLLFERGF